MNKESINSKDSSNTETLEIQEESPVAVESKESGQEFAEKILAKIKGYMNSFFTKNEAMKKIESTVYFDDPTIKKQIKSEINLDSQLDEIDTEVEKVQTETSENVNLTVGNFSKAYHHPEYRDKVAKEIKEARNSGQDVEAVRSEFYDKTASEKENFESQEKERSVAEIMKEKDLVIIHAIPLISLERKSTPENNPILKSNGYQDFRTSVEILSGLSPTISTSIPSPEKSQNGLYYPSGVILGEGKVLTAQSEDSGSVAHSLYKRIPKYGTENKTAIQSKININQTVEEGSRYNELTIENPKIAGLFYDLTEENSELSSENPKKNQLIENIIHSSQRELSQGEIQKEIDKIDEKWKNYVEEKQKERQQKKITQKFQLNTMKKYSEEMNVPLYIFKKENEELKKYKINFLPKEIESKTIEESEYTLEEVTAKDIYESKRDVSDEERKKMIEDIKNKGILSESAEKEVNKKFQDVESIANSQENASILLFSRMNNPTIRNQFIELLKASEEYEANVEKEDTSVLYDDDGDLIFDENGQVKTETKKIPSDYTPKTENEIKNTLDKRMNEVSLDTPISFNNEMPSGNSSEGARENISLYFELKPGVKLTNLQKSITEAHEKGHVIRPYEGDYFRQYFSRGFDVSEAVNYSEEELNELKIKADEAGVSLMDGIKERSEYLSDGREIAERMSQLKNYFGMKGDEKFTKEHLNYARDHYIKDTGFDNNMKSFFNGITKEKENNFIELINNSGI